MIRKVFFLFNIAFFGLMYLSCNAQRVSQIELKYERRQIIKESDVLGYNYGMYYKEDNQSSLIIEGNEIADILRERFSKMEIDTSDTHFIGYDVYAKLVCHIKGYGYDVLVVNKSGEDEYHLELNGKCMKMDETVLRFVTGLIAYHKSKKYPYKIEEEKAKTFWKE